MYWVPYWLPSMIVGVVFALGRRREIGQGVPSTIMIFMIDHIGDAVISGPLLRELKGAYPSAKLVAVSSFSAFPIVEKCPYLDEVIVVPKAHGWWKELRGAIILGRQLGRRRADLVIVPKDTINDGFNELISLVTDAKRKISLKPPLPVWRIRPLKFHLFYDEFVATEQDKHEAEYRLDIVRYLTGRTVKPSLESWLDDRDIEFADKFVASIKAGRNVPIIAFGVGASLAKRCWPLKNFAATIDQLSERLHFIPVILVAPQEAQLFNALAGLTHHVLHTLQGATLRENTALLRHCSLFIGNDSGPMHLAASVRVPVVELSCHPVAGPARHGNSPERFGPLVSRRRILRPEPQDELCSKNGCVFEDFPHCIAGLSPADVVSAALELMDGPFL